MAIVAVLVSVGFAACGDDDDDDNETETNENVSPTSGLIIDLGLPSGTKWASRNVGADSSEDYGDYFAWGETSPKDEYTSENSVTDNLSYSELKLKGIIDGNGNLTSSYDAATANWGKGWHMPTSAQITELCTSCSCKWTTLNGVHGLLATGTNGNSIFLPAAGYCSGTSLLNVGLSFTYFSSTLYEDSSVVGAYGMNSTYNNNGSNLNYHDTFYRYPGFAVRPVSE